MAPQYLKFSLLSQCSRTYETCNRLTCNRTRRVFQLYGNRLSHCRQKSTNLRRPARPGRNKEAAWLLTKFCGCITTSASIWVRPILKTSGHIFVTCAGATTWGRTHGELLLALT